MLLFEITGVKITSFNYIFTGLLRDNHDTWSVRSPTEKSEVNWNIDLLLGKIRCRTYLCAFPKSCVERDFPV